VKILIYLSSVFTAILRFLPAELSHKLALEGLNLLYKAGIQLIKNENEDNLVLLNLNFRNKLGLAAGLDKNGDYIECLDSLGFGFIELGTVTPRPQKGNKRPRLFRVKSKEALVNSMGFNNKGVSYLVSKVKNIKIKSKIGISIGKNFDTPIEDSLNDYKFCLEAVYQYADYVAVNISSPNTVGLRDLETAKYFETLIVELKALQDNLSSKHGHKPLLIKISPDITDKDLMDVARISKNNGIDGIIATNTTTSHVYKNFKGGLSGRPLFEISNKILANLRSIVGPEFLLIGSGGVMSKVMYEKKIEQGADLVQIYTGIIYKGPALVDKIING